MGIYYFAVDYSRKEQMWAPKSFSDKCIYHPEHPLPQMIAMKNCQGSNFQIVNDVSTYEEHEFKDVTKLYYTRGLMIKNNWISVKDSLPDFGDYRVCKNDQIVFVGMFRTTDWIFITPINHLMYGFVIGIPSYGEIIDVTHWMPLPELPDDNITGIVDDE